MNGQNIARYLSKPEEEVDFSFDIKTDDATPTKTASITATDNKTGAKVTVSIENLDKLDDSIEDILEKAKQYTTILGPKIKK